jgi:hypothetical protein
MNSSMLNTAFPSFIFCALSFARSDVVNSVSSARDIAYTQLLYGEKVDVSRVLSVAFVVITLLSSCCKASEENFTREHDVHFLQQGKITDPGSTNRNDSPYSVMACISLR